MIPERVTLLVDVMEPHVTSLLVKQTRNSRKMVENMYQNLKLLKNHFHNFKFLP